MKFAAIADIHGNYIALEAVLADADSFGITDVVNLGDHLSGPLEASRTADLLIEQRQNVSWPTFRLPMTVEVTTDGGTVRRVIDVDERRETIRVPLPAPPRRVVLDPDGWVLKDVVDDDTALSERPASRR